MSTNEWEALQSSRHVLNRPSAAFVAAAFLMLLTVALWFYSTSTVEQRARDRFLYRVDMAENVLVGRMNDYQQVLRGGQGVYAASETVSRAEWRIYVESLQLDSYLPGVQSVAFSPIVRAEDRRAHESAVRAEGFPDYSIFPEESSFAVSCVVLYIEPFRGRNLRAVGYDMYSETVRREAMDRARDTGKPALSGKVRLVFEEAPDVQPGFLVYLPIYRNGWPISTVDERRQALLGFINSSFRANDFLALLLRGTHADVELNLFDGRPSPDDLLYASEQTARVPRHVADREIEIAGRRWTARFSSSNAFEELTEDNRPILILVFGVVLNLAVFLILSMNARYQKHVSETAAALSLANEQLERLSVCDALTGIFNRRHFDEKLREDFLELGRGGRNFSLLMIDADHFKRINDTYGHQTGDEVLKRLARLLGDNTRATDFVARYGGEEFSVLIPNTEGELDGVAVGEKIRNAVAASDFPNVGRITVSVGVSCSSKTDGSDADIVRRADKALYLAKAQGRNRACFVFAERPSGPPRVQ